jgi:hypothetical protein
MLKIMTGNLTATQIKNALPPNELQAAHAERSPRVYP